MEAGALMIDIKRAQYHHNQDRGGRVDDRHQARPIKQHNLVPTASTYRVARLLIRFLVCLPVHPSTAFSFDNVVPTASASEQLQC
eukprot:scaffold324532_cov51-Attheya_sp.AAC.1